MAISNPKSYATYDQWHNLGITPFPIPPGTTSTPTRNPDNRILIQPAGWVGTNLLAFSIANQANTSTGVSILNANSNTLKVSVNKGSSPALVTTYWTVDMGPGASISAWGVSFQVEDGATNEGTWVFTKGKGDDDGDDFPG